VDIEQKDYEALVAAKADGESKVNDLTAQLAERDRRIEQLEAEKVKAEEEREAAKAEAEQAREAGRVAAMKDERLSALGAGFRAKLDKLETTARRVREQAGKLTDEEWAARLDELEETLGVKRDAKLDGGGDGDEDDGKGSEHTEAGLLFERQDVARTGLFGGGEPSEVTASAGREPSPGQRQSVIGGLVRRQRQGEKAKA
jgi:hypothetical protein